MKILHYQFVGSIENFKVLTPEELESFFLRYKPRLLWYRVYDATMIEEFVSDYAKRLDDKNCLPPEKKQV